MDTAFFILSKLVGLILQVETWLAIGMALSLLGGILTRPRLARRSGGATLAVLLIVGLCSVGEVLLRPLETAFPPRTAPAQIDGIVVLGGVEDQRATAAWGQPQLNAAAERLTAAAALAIEYPDARLLFLVAVAVCATLWSGARPFPAWRRIFSSPSGSNQTGSAGKTSPGTRPRTRGFPTMWPTPPPVRPGFWSPARFTWDALLPASRPPDGARSRPTP